MTTPTVRPLPAAPSPADPPELFDSRAYAFTAALPGFGSDFNAAVAFLVPRMTATGEAAAQAAAAAAIVAEARPVIEHAAVQVAEDRAAVDAAAGLVAADREVAALASAAALAAAESSGDVRFFDTHALALAALAGLGDDQIVEVMVDESRAGQRSRYRVDAGQLVYKAAASGTSIGTSVMTIPAQAYALDRAHRLRLLRFTAAGSVTVSIPADADSNDAWDEWGIYNAAAGALTLSPASGVTLEGPRILRPSTYAVLKRLAIDHYLVIMVTGAPRGATARRTAQASTGVAVANDSWPTSSDGALLLSAAYVATHPSRALLVRVSVPTASSHTSNGCVVWLCAGAGPALAAGTNPVFPPGTAPFASSIEFTAIVPAAEVHALELRFAAVDDGEVYIGSWDGDSGGFAAPYTAQLTITELDHEFI